MEQIIEARRDERREIDLLDQTVRFGEFQGIPKTAAQILVQTRLGSHPVEIAFRIARPRGQLRHEFAPGWQTCLSAESGARIQHAIAILAGFDESVRYRSLVFLFPGLRLHWFLGPFEQKLQRAIREINRDRRA